MKKYKYMYFHRATSAYRIAYKKYFVMEDHDQKVALRAYKECEECNWNRECLVKIHDKYSKYNKEREGIYKQGNGYVLYIHKNGQRIYCGRCKTVTEAKKKKKAYLNGTEEIPVKRRGKYRRRGGNNKSMRYIYRTIDGTYTVSKGGEHYGTYKSLEDAQRERDILERVDWDFDAWVEAET